MASPESTPPKAWWIQQNFVSRDRNVQCLDKLQTCQLDVECHIRSGTHIIRSGADYNLLFSLFTSTQQSGFQIDLCLKPEGRAKNDSAWKEERLSVKFLTYDPNGPRFPERIPFQYVSNLNNPVVSGPYSFSRQLQDVQFSYGDHPHLSPDSLPLWNDVPLGHQMCFSWTAQHCIAHAVSRPQTGLSNATRQAITQFRGIIHQVMSHGATLVAVTRRESRLGDVWWPWLAATPAPVPESFFAWLYKQSDKQDEIMQFETHSFERLPEWVDCARAIRRRKFWWKQDGATPAEDANQLPSPLELFPLPAVTRFTNEREYLAHVLGNHTYEHIHNRTNHLRYYNGVHSCEVFPSQQGLHRHLILLNIRPPQTRTTPADLAELPQPDERVLVSFKASDRDSWEETWAGKVVRIPGRFSGLGRNVAVSAERPPSFEGRILEPHTRVADFFFGHSSSPTSAPRRYIIDAMVGTGIGVEAPVQWFKKLLLAHDNYALDNANVNYLTADQLSHVNAVANARGLDSEQRMVLDAYFKQRMTIVTGPPGTGKSTLIDNILQLEEDFNHKVWVCTNSNAAADLLASIVCQRKSTSRPAGQFRVRTLFDEALHARPNESNVVAPDIPVYGNGTAAQAIQEFLATQDNADEIMALESHIKGRVNLVKRIADRQMPSLYAEEHDHLMALINAYQSLVKFIDTTTATPATRKEAGTEKADVEKWYNKALLTLQKAYLQRARAIFSTMAAGASPLLRNWQPAAIIMDEASQFMEASAVFPILKVLAGGKLRKILLVGDHNQLPPIILADRNPFRSSGQVSLMERLIKAGTPSIQLKTQYRMHPTISSIVNKTIYNGSLIDGANTTRRPQIVQFQKFAQQLAIRSGVQDFPNTSAIVISPVQHASYPWGSQKASGSTSRFNLQTAAITFRLVHQLITVAKFPPMDIMVIAFYTDQVGLLKALFADEDNFAGLHIGTVDGSQGKERPVVIVDTVTLGPGANESMGYLAIEKRRFNVAMSRAMVGRIVICHRDFVPKDIRGKTAETGPWFPFLDEAQSNGLIIPGMLFNQPLPPHLRSKFTEVRTAFLEKTQTG